jgi:hypothetical protein
MDQLQYLIATALSGSNRGDLAFSALPEAPVMPVRRSVIDRFRISVKTIVSLMRGVANSRRRRELGEALPIDGTATMV